MSGVFDLTNEATQTVFAAKTSLNQEKYKRSVAAVEADMLVNEGMRRRPARMIVQVVQHIITHNERYKLKKALGTMKGSDPLHMSAQDSLLFSESEVLDSTHNGMVNPLTTDVVTVDGKGQPTEGEVDIVVKSFSNSSGPGSPMVIATSTSQLPQPKPSQQ